MSIVKKKRRVKVKITAKKNQKSSSNVDSTSSHSQFRFPRYEAFSKQWRTIRHPQDTFGFIRTWWEKIYGEFPPVDVRMELLYYKLAYRLVKRDCKKENIPFEGSIRTNYLAAKEFNIEKFTPGLRDIIKIQLKESKEDQMAKKVGKKKVAASNGKVVKSKKAAAPAKAQKISVKQMYLTLFDANYQNKLTDDQMAAEMRKSFPDRKAYTAADVAAVRSLYNNGKLMDGVAAPKVRLEKFGGETKAKKVAAPKATKKVATKKVVKKGTKKVAAKRK